MEEAGAAKAAMVHAPGRANTHSRRGRASLRGGDGRLRPLFFSPFPVHLTLLVPELIWPEPGDALTLAQLPAEHFSWLTGRASFQLQPASAHEACLLALC